MKSNKNITPFLAMFGLTLLSFALQLMTPLPVHATDNCGYGYDIGQNCYSLAGYTCGGTWGYCVYLNCNYEWECMNGAWSYCGFCSDGTCGTQVC